MLYKNIFLILILILNNSLFSQKIINNFSFIDYNLTINYIVDSIMIKEYNFFLNPRVSPDPILFITYKPVTINFNEDIRFINNDYVFENIKGKDNFSKKNIEILNDSFIDSIKLTNKKTLINNNISKINDSIFYNKSKNPYKIYIPCLIDSLLPKVLYKNKKKKIISDSISIENLKFCTYNNRSIEFSQPYFSVKNNFFILCVKNKIISGSFTEWGNGNTYFCCLFERINDKWKFIKIFKPYLE